MNKEIIFYVRKEVACGQVKYVIESNIAPGKIWWFDTLPSQKHGGKIGYHESFNGLLNNVIYQGELSVDRYRMKVFYNQEYKTIGNYVVNENKDKSHSYNSEDTVDIFPLNKKEILHFMNLFHNYGK